MISKIVGIINNYKMVDQDKSLRNFKTIIVGKSSVGKSTILLRYIQGQFFQQNSTVAVDYRFKKVTAGGYTFNLQLWDTAGQQRYKTIVYSFFKLSKAACVVFDITNESSLDDVDSWMDQLNVQCGKQIPKILLGNKNLKQQLQRMKPKLERLKQQYDCEIFIVSAKTGQNIDKAFQFLANRLSKILEADQPEQAPPRITFKLDDPSIKTNKTRKRDKCCN